MFFPLQLVHSCEVEGQLGVNIGVNFRSSLLAQLNVPHCWHRHPVTRIGVTGTACHQLYPAPGLWGSHNHHTAARHTQLHHASMWNSNTQRPNSVLSSLTTALLCPWRHWAALTEPAGLRSQSKTHTLTHLGQHPKQAQLLTPEHQETSASCQPGSGGRCRGKSFVPCPHTAISTTGCCCAYHVQLKTVNDSNLASSFYVTPRNSCGRLLNSSPGSASRQ